MRILRSKRLVALAATVLVAAGVATVSFAAVDSRTMLADVTNIHYQIVHFQANGFDGGWIANPGIVIVSASTGRTSSSRFGASSQQAGLRKHEGVSSGSGGHSRWS